MKLSEKTLKILRNYATLNQGILIRPGNLLATRSIAGDAVSEATIDEQFPCEFALYNLQVFLNTLKLFSSPILDFRNADEGYLYICEEDNLDFKVKYTFAKKDHIKYPKRRPVVKNNDIMFELDKDTIDSIIKASNVLQLPHIVIVPGSKEGMINIEVADIKNNSSNKFSVSINAEINSDKKFKLIFNMENFKLISNSYNVTISGKTIAAFESDDIDYYIGMDVHSKF